MSLPGICPEARPFGLNRERANYLEERKLFSIQLAPTFKCGAGCAYCILGCETTTPGEFPKEVLQKALDEAVDCGVKSLSWQGGDPLMYPHLYEMVDRYSERGAGSNIFTNGLISKRDAKELTRLATSDPHYECTIVHIDTIDPEVDEKINDIPGNFEKRMAGYRRLLETGHPPERVMGVMTVTAQAAETAEETIDWFLDEMGAGSIGLCGFKPVGFGRDPDFEPTLTQHRKVHEYRAKRLGQGWLGSGGGTMVGSLMCRTDLCLVADGSIYACACVPEFKLGDIYQGDSVMEVFERYRDTFTFERVKGACANCDKNPYCVGCRGVAWVYLGDPWAADPKCWLNPDAKEKYGFYPGTDPTFIVRTREGKPKS